jgi:hypothetical protein
VSPGDRGGIRDAPFPSLPADPRVNFSTPDALGPPGNPRHPRHRLPAWIPEGLGKSFSLITTNWTNERQKTGEGKGKITTVTLRTAIAPSHPATSHRLPPACAADVVKCPSPNCENCENYSRVPPTPREETPLPTGAKVIFKRPSAGRKPQRPPLEPRVRLPEAGRGSAPAPRSFRVTAEGPSGQGRGRQNQDKLQGHQSKVGPRGPPPNSSDDPSAHGKPPRPAPLSPLLPSLGSPLPPPPA